MVINLLSQKRNEEQHQIADIENAMSQLEKNDKRVKYNQFDFLEKCPDPKHDLRNQFKLIYDFENIKKSFGCSITQINYSAENFCFIEKSKQNGVFRLACNDTINRTGLFQMIDGWCFILSMLHKEDLHKKTDLSLKDLLIPKKDLVIEYQKLWANEIEARSDQTAGENWASSILKKTVNSNEINWKNESIGISYLIHDQALVDSFTAKLKHNSKGLSPSTEHEKSLVVKNQYLQLKVFMATWNVGGHTPHNYKDYLSLFERFQNDQPDIIVITLEEIFELKGVNITKIILGDNKDEKQVWVNILSQLFNKFGNYVYMDESDQVGLCQLIWVKKDLRPNATIVNNKNYTKLGHLGAGNKGAIQVSLKIYDSCFDFCGCHLTAGSDPKHLETRIGNQNQIIHENFSKIDDKSNHFCFIMGDFNFRVKANAEEVRAKILEYQKFGKEYIQQDLLNDDELLNCMSGNFYPFRESKIEFLPSYKMEFKKQAYIDSRTPSWYFFLEF